jgi:hypothetical protein
MEDIDNRIMQLKNITVPVRTSINLVKASSRDSRNNMLSEMQDQIDKEKISSESNNYSARLFSPKTKPRTSNTQSRPQMPEQPQKSIRPGRSGSQD